MAIANPSQELLVASAFASDMLLCKEEPLPEAYRDHALVNSRNYKGMRECHIQPDWLLVYKVIHETLILELIRTGSHSDLF